MKQEIILIALAIPIPVTANKMISFSSSLTHVVVDTGAAPWDQGWWKVVWGLQPLPHLGHGGCSHPGDAAGAGTDLPLLPALLTLLTLHKLSFATAFIFKSFQCCLCGNHFRIGKGKSIELGELREPSSL